MIIESQPSLGSKPKKEMLSVTYESDAVLHRKRPVVRINSSSLELIQLCKRKAQYVLEKELQSGEESPTTLFGSAIHKGLESWYNASRESRRADLSSCTGFSNEPSEHNEKCAQCKALHAFNQAAERLSCLDLGDKRHPYSGERILTAYFKKYQDDPYEILVDEKGPIVERTLEATLIDKPDLKVIYFGTLDCVLRDVQTGVTVVVDHKTTSALGQEFLQRVKPNFQYCGYVWLVQQALNIQTDMFMVNGLQVAKTKTDFNRQLVTYNESDFQELATAVEWNTREWLRAKELDVFPMNTPNPCTQWSGCQFRDICAAPPTLRGVMLKGKFAPREE